MRLETEEKSPGKETPKPGNEIKDRPPLKNEIRRPPKNEIKKPGDRGKKDGGKLFKGSLPSLNI